MKLKLWIKQNSPEILMVTSIITAVGSVVAAVIATRQLPKVTSTAKKTIIDVHNKMNDELTDEDDIVKGKAELKKTYVKTGLKIAGLYLPSAALLAALIILLFLLVFDSYANYKLPVFSLHQQKNSVLSLVPQRKYFLSLVSKLNAPSTLCDSFQRL